MNFVKLTANNRGYYSYAYASNIEMNILANFLTDDVGCRDIDFFRNWALADKEDPNSKYYYSIGGNATYLEEDDDSW